MTVNPRDVLKTADAVLTLVQDKTNPVKCYDVTVPRDESDLDPGFLLSFVKDHCKQYVFAPQIGTATEYPHWQCRFSLKVKTRLNNAIKEFHTFLHPTAHVEQTLSERGSNPQYREYYQYCSDRRTLAPNGRVWSDKDALVPDDLISVNGDRGTLYPWQRELFEMPNDDRRICFVYDTRGGFGKSYFCSYLEINNLGLALPPLKSKDIHGAVYDYCTTYGFPGIITVDLPRAFSSRDELRDIFVGLETIKSGHAYDARYTWKSTRFRSPKIIVFSNLLPDPNWLSYDRWDCYELCSVDYRYSNGHEAELIGFDLRTAYRKMWDERADRKAVANECVKKISSSQASIM